MRDPSKKTVQEEDELMEPRRPVHMHMWQERTPLSEKKIVAPLDETSHSVKISIGGPREGAYSPPEGSMGWNAGDIDFRWDGAIFIRNPYLADAIEKHLQAAYQRSLQNGGGNFLKIIRDEGWSGTQTNIIC